MEPLLTERDVALLMLNEDSWVTLGAVLGLKVRMPHEGEPGDVPPVVEGLPA